MARETVQSAIPLPATRGTSAIAFKGPALLQRFLYPTSGRPAPAPAKVAVTLASGQTVNGTLAARDEFFIGILDFTGRADPGPWLRQVQAEAPRTRISPSFGKYTDDDIHNVLAYLQTLK